MNGTDEEYMRLAIAEAKKAPASEVPVGAVVVKGGEVIASAHNEKETRRDATAHAELLALQRAAAAVGNWHLEGCTLYVTLEPCCMCAGAVVNARPDRLVYGTPDPRFGACGTLMNLVQSPALNHRVALTAGILQPECAALLTGFFKEKRMFSASKND